MGGGGGGSHVMRMNINCYSTLLPLCLLCSCKGSESHHLDKRLLWRDRDGWMYILIVTDRHTDRALCIVDSAHVFSI